jgi:hypothetical protein
MEGVASKAAASKGRRVIMGVSPASMAKGI